MDINVMCSCTSLKANRSVCLTLQSGLIFDDFIMVRVIIIVVCLGLVTLERAPFTSIRCKVLWFYQMSCFRNS